MGLICKISENQRLRSENERFRSEIGSLRMKIVSLQRIYLDIISCCGSAMHRTESLLPRGRTGANMKRTRQVSDHLSEAKREGTKQGRHTYIGESLTSQQPEPRNAQHNWIKKDKDEENFDLHRINQCVAWPEEPGTDFETLVFKYFSEEIERNDRIKKALAWQVEADLQGSDFQNIIEKIKKIERRAKAAGIEKRRATDEMKPILLEIGEEIEKLNEPPKDSIKETDLQEILLTKFSSEIATNGPTTDQDQDKISLQTLTELSALPLLFYGDIATNGPISNGSLETWELQYSIKDFIKMLFALEKNQVVVSCFQKELENPDDLEPIARRIKKERGKDTEFELLNIEALVCAAIKQMEELPAEELNLDMLLRWGAVLNKAKDLGFQVKFAEVQLKKNLYAYFSLKKFG